jgi:hypothetical protein
MTGRRDNPQERLGFKLPSQNPHQPRAIDHIKPVARRASNRDCASRLASDRRRIPSRITQLLLAQHRPHIANDSRAHLLSAVFRLQPAGAP